MPIFRYSLIQGELGEILQILIKSAEIRLRLQTYLPRSTTLAQFLNFTKRDSYSKVSFVFFSLISLAYTKI